MYQTSRTIKCPECGNSVEEVCTFDARGQLIENHAFCADSGGDGCLWGGEWPNNQRNVENNKKREMLKAMRKG
jgi:hypothetical protein